MNINSFSSQISSPRPIGGRLDITLNDLNKINSISNTQSAEATQQVGTISGVLNDEENMALSTMFQSSGQKLYTVSGNAQTTRIMPGMSLDIQA